MKNNEVRCTSHICPYIKECGRHARDDTSNINYSYIDLTYSGCDIGSGFDRFETKERRY